MKTTNQLEGEEAMHMSVGGGCWKTLRTFTTDKSFSISQTTHCNYRPQN